MTLQSSMGPFNYIITCTFLLSYTDIITTFDYAVLYKMVNQQTGYILWAPLLSLMIVVCVCVYSQYAHVSQMTVQGYKRRENTFL